MDATDEGEVLAADVERLERVLLARHDRFLAFVASRLGSRAEADDVLQSAYQRAMERGVPEADDEGVVAWFFRVLRNALVDRSRRRDAERRGAERHAGELPEAADLELEREVCACIHDVLPSLKPEYADVVRQVDLAQRSIAEVAAAQAITANNAGVRLHRARQALKKQLLRTCGACAAHGCLDCRCKTHRAGSPA